MKAKTLYQITIFTLVLCTLIFINRAIIFAEESDSRKGSPSKTIEKISIEKAYELIQNNNENPDFVILDVRTPGEYADGHIENAVNIDFLSPTFNDDLETLDKSKTYVIHCRSGGRSSKALLIMDQLDFQNAYDMGGLIDWEKKGYPVVK